MTALAGVGRPAPEKHKYSGDRQGALRLIHARLDVIWKDVPGKRTGRHTKSIAVTTKKNRENCGQEICGFLTWRKSANWFIILTLVSLVVEYGTRRALRVDLDLLFHFLASSLLLRFTYWLLQVLAADPQSIQADPHSYVHLIWITVLPSCHGKFVVLFKRIKETKWSSS
jgi:hypothetical protein